MIKDKIQSNYSLASLSTFKIGGPAEYFIEISTKEEVEEVWSYAKENNLGITLLGGGSNILVADNGVKGLVIKLNNTTDGHSKTWIGSLFDDGTVITEWGRIGAELQSKEFSFEIQEEAEAFLDKKYNEKIKKGYVSAKE